MCDASNEEVVRAAAGGDQAAWRALVRRFAGLVWSVARSYGLSQQDAEDASQITWLLAATHIRAVRDPAAIGGWLVTTVRRESVRLLRRRGREIPADPHDSAVDAVDRHADHAEEITLRAELVATVRAAFALLPEHCRILLTLLMRDPPPTYSEISVALDIPRGSIGPTRARCIHRLREIAGL